MVELEGNKKNEKKHKTTLEKQMRRNSFLLDHNPVHFSIKRQRVEKRILLLILEEQESEGRKDKTEDEGIKDKDKIVTISYYVKRLMLIVKIRKG